MASYPTRHRSPGEGSIYAYKGKWRGQLTWTDRAGIRQRRIISGKTQADVRRQLAELRVELDRGLAPAKPQTVAEFLAAWLERQRENIRPSTWRQYDQHTRTYLAPHLGRLTLTQLAPADVERMTTAITKSGRSPRTAQLARTILRRALRDAQRDGLVHRNVAALARAPRVPSPALAAGVDYLEPAELRRLVSAGKLHPLGQLVTLAATTGLRLGELLGLSWADVDTAGGSLTVRRSLARAWDGGWALAEPKTARSRRTIILPTSAIAALARRRELQDADQARVGDAWQNVDGLVFTDEIGRPMDGRAVNKGFHQLLEAAGLPSIPFHGLRHSAATMMLAGGESLKTVADQLGHATITITADRYAGLTSDQRRSVAATVDRALGGDL